jgi:hypothetical protein
LSPKPVGVRLLPDIPIAFLVDGDNATATAIPQILAEVSKYGTLVIRRVYGDWTSPGLASWRKVLHIHALAPIQQFANVSGKNATDSALIIDAMDILHAQVVRGFCIVSSDSDYTRLATRIREAGLFVLGVGRATTPPAFVNACNVFATVENLNMTAPDLLAPSSEAPTSKSQVSPNQAEPPGEPGRASAVQLPLPPAAAAGIIRKAYLTIVGEAGYVYLSSLGNTLLKLDPAFDARTYGFSKLVSLLETLSNDFDVERHPERGPGTIYVRLREATKS